MSEAGGPYFIRVRGRVQGPFDLEQLKRLRQRGQFSRACEFSVDGQKWQSASGLDSVFTAPVRSVRQAEPELIPEAVAEPPAGSEATSALAGTTRAAWYYTSGEEQRGPVSLLELRRMVSQGVVAPTDLAWKDGMPDWTAVGAVPELQVTSPSREVMTPAPLGANQATHSSAKNKVEDRPLTTPGTHKQRRGIMIAASLGIIATFLPWVHAPFIGSVTGTTVRIVSRVVLFNAPFIGSVTGTTGDGWITLVLFLPSLIIALCGDSRTAIRGGKRLGLAIPAALAAMLGIWTIVRIQQRKLEISDDNPLANAMSASIQIGFGLYLLVAAGVAVAAVAWLLAKDGE